MLDPSPEFIGHWGRFGDPGLPIVVRPLQSNASNDQRVLISFITELIKFIQLNFPMVTRGFDIKVGMLKGPRWRDDEVDSVFKHDLCKLVIAKMGSAITYDCTRGTESGEERFKKFANNSGVIGLKMVSHDVCPKTAPKAKSACTRTYVLMVHYSLWRQSGLEPRLPSLYISWNVPGALQRPKGACRAGRKAHLLEDKQIPSVGAFDEVSFYTLFRAFGWLLEEILVTWAHLEKQRTRLQLYTKSHEDNAYSGWRWHHN
ncbi:hypothetical protein Tco_0840118 [Tanacetum coccineum]|uniref:Uncharacterized protein n=1 Tax=Tanacetum coccineum TaxID=301880 RepID=A0ABQ5AX36_9ASTR